MSNLHYTEQILIKITKQQMEDLEVARKEYNKKKVEEKDWNGELTSTSAFARQLIGLGMKALEDDDQDEARK